jgi:parallel beta-helix repeat protein
VTLKAYPGETVIMRPNVGAMRVLDFLSNQHYIVIDGLILDGINVSYDTVKISWHISDPSTGAHHIRIINSEIMNGRWNGIGFGDIGGNELINNRIHHNGRAGGCNVGVPCPPAAQADQPPGYGQGHALYVASPNNIVDGNEIYMNGEYGIHNYSGSNGGNPHHNVYRNNIVHHNGNNATRYGHKNGDGILVAYNTEDGNVAYNNVVYANNGTGIRVRGGTNTRVFNNTVYDNRNGIYIDQSAPSNMIRNNIAYRSQNQNFYISGATHDHNLIGADPRFVNAAAGDLRLQAGSPAIDAGSTVPLATEDISGVLRPQGSAYDIGAYEYSYQGSAIRDQLLLIRVPGF